MQLAGYPYGVCPSCHLQAQPGGQDQSANRDSDISVSCSKSLKLTLSSVEENPALCTYAKNHPAPGSAELWVPAGILKDNHTQNTDGSTPVVA